MSELIVIGYDDEHRAAEVLETLKEPQKEHSLELDDAVYVTKDLAGEVELHQSAHPAASGAKRGAFWGLLIGALFLAPVAGVAVGAGAGALRGALKDAGIEDNFMSDVSQLMGPGNSAIFLLVRKATPDKVLPQLAQFGGMVLRTSLSYDAEARLQTALVQGGKDTLIQRRTV